MSRVGIKVMFYFYPVETTWSTLSDFEHWVAKHLAENGMEGERIEVIGSPELIIVIKAIKEAPVISEQKQKSFKEQIISLKKGLK